MDAERPNYKDIILQIFAVGNFFVTIILCSIFLYAMQDHNNDDPHVMIYHCGEMQDG